jgi:hypothetical protein
MQAQMEEEEDVTLQFVRQLYDSCVERHGEAHEQTRLLLRYLAGFESPLTHAASLGSYRTFLAMRSR